MDKAWRHAETEENLYKWWEMYGLMKASDHPKKPFSIVLPPPNANADLHLGHAMYVYEDVMIRYRKMKGEDVLWLPGADHAGFETQYVFEKELARKGESRFDFDRKTLFQKIKEFVGENRKKMTKQLKRLGFFIDWDRFTYTLDPGIIRVVYDTFEKMFHEGLIYRENRLVNYCTHCGTSFSDLEVKHVERKDPLYYMKYGPFTLATVRPETKFGDTALAVNPKDRRYMKWIGKTVDADGLLGTFQIKVIGDEAIDPTFGTGVAKVTPAHDFTDFEIAKRHHLEMKTVIDQAGRLTKIAGPYAGMKVNRARDAVVKDLRKRGLLVKTDEHYTHNVSVCYKCQRVLEPLLMKQWYVKIRSLADRAIDAINANQVVFTNERFKKSALRWLMEFHDWNISRQIVWGIRIPAYECTSTGTWFVSKQIPVSCHICKGQDFKQDTDTFDTWFSSAQWPFATLLNTHKDDFKNYYPTSVMETGYDILPWWVCRMLMIGLYTTGEVPFRTVYLHGMVRDTKGQKMSKSKGNVINPIVMVDKYGADALRAALVFEVGDGNDVSISEDKIRAMRNFANKIWNIGRFLRMTQMSIVKSQNGSTKKQQEKTVTDTIYDLLKESQDIKKQYLAFMDTYKFSAAFGLVYEFLWHRFADYFIEQLKEEANNGNIKVLEALDTVYESCLKMLHPYMPFVTEAVWKIEHGEKESILKDAL